MYVCMFSSSDAQGFFFRAVSQFSSPILFQMCSKRTSITWKELRVLTLARSNLLPTLSYISTFSGSKVGDKCPRCGGGAEDLAHIVLDCPESSPSRDEFLESVEAALDALVLEVKLPANFVQVSREALLFFVATTHPRPPNMFLPPLTTLWDFKSAAKNVLAARLGLIPQTLLEVMTLTSPLPQQQTKSIFMQWARSYISTCAKYTHENWVGRSSDPRVRKAVSS